MNANIFNNKGKKPENSIELQLKSNKNINYVISIYYLEDKLYINAISKDYFPNKKYEKCFSIEEAKRNKYFNLDVKRREKIDVIDIYDELDEFVKEHDKNAITLQEKENSIILIFLLDSNEECPFELGETLEQKFENIWNKLEEFELFKMQLNELIDENKRLKEQITENEITIKSGEILFDFWSTGSHPMFTQEGDRHFEQHINFDEEYETVPKVMVSLKGLDADKMENLRIKISAENISTSGFDIRVFTWNDSKIYRVFASWISYG
jgi:hypothetical protein